jgi:threonine dehydrogenase-like Zn-dependent dehydrogenase
MHEIVGEVVETSDTDLAVGQMVVGWATRFDGIAEYVSTEGKSLWPYDPALDPGHAVLIQPLACVLHAVDRLGDLEGTRCAVLGQGAIGMLFSSVLKARGASSVTAVDRRDLASTASGLGVDEFVCANTAVWSHEVGASAPYEVVIEAVGHQTLTLQHAIDVAADGARIFYFGVPDDPVYPVDMESMIRKHLTLMSGGTRDRRRMLGLAEDYLRQRPEIATTLVSHRYPVDRVQEAYDLSFRSASDRLKVVVDMQ